jgi:hypothetical protein
MVKIVHENIEFILDIFLENFASINIFFGMVVFLFVTHALLPVLPSWCPVCACRSNSEFGGGYLARIVNSCPARVNQ